MTTDRPIKALADELLVASDARTVLSAHGLLDADGLTRLLDVAEGLLNDDPGRARRLAELCREFAPEAGSPAVIPRADYVRAGAHNLNGELEEDLRLTRSAYEGYVALGMNLEALRTHVGRMAALLELGRYDEALEAGRVVVESLEGREALEVEATAEEAGLLRAMVQQNIGGCLEYVGRYDEALGAYDISEREYRKLGLEERLGEVLDNRGAVLSCLGRGTEALAAHRAAAEIFDRAGQTLSYAKALGNIGETQRSLADYTASLDTLGRARELLSSLDVRAEEGFLLRNVADSYLALNLYSEALAAYREVVGLLNETGMEHDRAQALWSMGAALAARWEISEAEEALAGAAVAFEAAGNAPMLSGVMLERAALQEIQDLGDDALATAHRALELVPERSWPVQHVYARLRLADLLLPDGDAVEQHLLAARDIIDRLALPHLRYRLDERLGHLRRRQGRKAESLILLEAAVEEIERQRGAVAQDAMRVSFLQDKTAAYEDLLLLHLEDEGGARRALAVAERAKSRALVDLLGGLSEGEAVSSGPDRRMRELQGDLNAVYSELLHGTDAAGRSTPLPALRARTLALETEIGRLRLQRSVSSAAFESGTELFEPLPATAAVPVELPTDPAGPALLAYHVVGDEVMAFVVIGGEVGVVRRLTTVEVVRQLSQRLAVHWDRFRLGGEFARRNMALLERSALQLLSALHEGLVAPLEPYLRAFENAASGVPGLAIIPHGLLHGVPFHALFDGERYLLERFEISYAPSATVFTLCQAKGGSSAKGSLVLGVEDPSIPAATEEACLVAGRLSGAEVHTGEGATVDALVDGARGAGVLHLACHGIFRSENPMFSALKLHDGWLTAADALRLNLPEGALVVLSACESGRSEVVGGDEILGLARAFLGAGAATLVVSMWLVHDETTAELMDEWYRRIDAGGNRASALRATQLEMMRHHPHPYYWAPFVLMGRR